MKILLLLFVVFLFFGFTKPQRMHIFKRDNARCVKCGRSWSQGYMLECDHVVPLSDGGSNTVDNGQLLCRTCHADKHADLAYKYKRKGNKKKHDENAYAARAIRKRSVWRW